MRGGICLSVVCSLLLFSNSADAFHDDILYSPDDDVIFVECQDPKNQVERFGNRMQCDLDAGRARVCADGIVTLLADGEAEVEGCNVTPYVEGVWRRYNENKDYGDVLTVPTCLAGQDVYLCVGAPPMFHR